MTFGINIKSHFFYTTFFRLAWNRKYPWKPQLPKKLNSPWIQDRESKEKLYAQLCCIAFLTNSINSNNDFKQRLKALLTEYAIVDVAAMGFPKNWEIEPLWKCHI